TGLNVKRSRQDMPCALPTLKAASLADLPQLPVLPCDSSSIQ
ncbi:12449_t:CDS:1, partial [Rhizophagus irregularis]